MEQALAFSLISIRDKLRLNTHGIITSSGTIGFVLITKNSPFLILVHERLQKTPVLLYTVAVIIENRVLNLKAIE